MNIFELLNSWFIPESHDIDKIVVGSPLVLNMEIFAFIILGLLIGGREKQSAFLSRGLTDTAKGLAIFAIVINHLCRHALVTYQDLSSFAYLGTKGVAVFLVLSGYGLSCSYQNKGLKDYFKKKFLKIYITFLICSMVIVLFSAMLPNVQVTIVDLVKQVAGFKITDRNFWYVNFLFFWYAAFFLIYKLRIDTNTKIVMLFVASFFVIFCDGMAPNTKINAFSFPVGVLVAEYKKSISSLLEKFNIVNTLLLAVLFAIALLAYSFAEYWIEHYAYMYAFFFIIMGIVYFGYRPSFTEFMFSLVIFFIGWRFAFETTFSDNIVFSLKNVVLAVMAIFVMMKIFQKWYSYVFSFLGQHSLEIFLLHGFFMYTCDFILYRGRIEITFWVYLLFIVLLSCFIKMMANRMVLLVDHAKIEN